MLPVKGESMCVNEGVSEKVQIQQAKKEVHRRKVLSKHCLVGHWGKFSRLFSLKHWIVNS